VPIDIPAVRPPPPPVPVDSPELTALSRRLDENRSAAHPAVSPAVAPSAPTKPGLGDPDDSDTAEATIIDRRGPSAPALASTPTAPSAPASVPPPAKPTRPPTMLVLASSAQLPKPPGSVGAPGAPGAPPQSKSGSTSGRIKLGPYEIVRPLGKGGMGTVYEGWDVNMQRPAAIKVPTREVVDDPEAVKRFLREARAAGVVHHPNLVAVYHVGEEAGVLYIAMELVTGGSCSDWLAAKGPMSEAQATWIIAEAARGLGAAHAAGMVHRDVKPANLMLTADGSVKVADFGLAKNTMGDSAANLTATGQVMGTPNYMSPEQCQGLPLDGRSDLYSLGATYYALLTGKPPFAAEHNTALLFKHLTAPIPDPRRLRPELPEGCTRIIRRAMAKKPEDRYRDAEEMVADLQRIEFGGTGPDGDGGAGGEGDTDRIVLSALDTTDPLAAVAVAARHSARKPRTAPLPATPRPSDEPVFTGFSWEDFASNVPPAVWVSVVAATLLLAAMASAYVLTAPRDPKDGTGGTGGTALGTGSGAGGPGGGDPYAAGTDPVAARVDACARMLTEIRSRLPTLEDNEDIVGMLNHLDRIRQECLLIGTGDALRIARSAEGEQAALRRRLTEGAGKPVIPGVGGGPKVFSEEITLFDGEISRKKLVVGRAWKVAEGRLTFDPAAAAAPDPAAKADPKTGPKADPTPPDGPPPEFPPALLLFSSDVPLADDFRLRMRVRWESAEPNRRPALSVVYRRKTRGGFALHYSPDGCLLEQRLDGLARGMPLPYKAPVGDSDYDDVTIEVRGKVHRVTINRVQVGGEVIFDDIDKGGFQLLAEGGRVSLKDLRLFVPGRP
jgi:hypothetical protein